MSLPSKGDLIKCTQKFKGTDQRWDEPPRWSPGEWGIITNIFNRPEKHYFHLSSAERFWVFTSRGDILRDVEVKHFKKIET